MRIHGRQMHQVSLCGLSKRLEFSPASFFLAPGDAPLAGILCLAIVLNGAFPRPFECAALFSIGTGNVCFLRPRLLTFFQSSIATRDAGVIAIAKNAGNPGDRLFIFPCQNGPHNVANFTAGTREVTHMSKMNFAYNPPKTREPEVRVPLMAIGYAVLALTMIWMIAKPYMG